MAVNSQAQDDADPLDLARARSQERMWAMMAHDYNEKTRMLRAAMARGQGLPEADFATLYPGGQQTYNLTQVAQPAPASIPAAPAVPAKIRLWPQLLASAGLGLAGGAAIPIANALKLSSPPAPATSTIPTAPAPVPTTQAPVPPVDGTIVTEQQGKTGWKTLWSLPAKRLPDGTAQTSDGRVWRPKGDGSTWEAVP